MSLFDNGVDRFRCTCFVSLQAPSLVYRFLHTSNSQAHLPCVSLSWPFTCKFIFQEYFLGNLCFIYKYKNDLESFWKAQRHYFLFLYHRSFWLVKQFARLIQFSHEKIINYQLCWLIQWLLFGDIKRGLVILEWAMNNCFLS